MASRASAVFEAEKAKPRGAVLQPSEAQSLHLTEVKLNKASERRGTLAVGVGKRPGTPPARNDEELEKTQRRRDRGKTQEFGRSTTNKDLGRSTTSNLGQRNAKSTTFRSKTRDNLVETPQPGALPPSPRTGPSRTIKKKKTQAGEFGKSVTIMDPKENMIYSKSAEEARDVTVIRAAMSHTRQALNTIRAEGEKASFQKVAQVLNSNLRKLNIGKRFWKKSEESKEEKKLSLEEAAPAELCDILMDRISQTFEDGEEGSEDLLADLVEAVNPLQDIIKNFEDAEKDFKRHAIVNFDDKVEVIDGDRKTSDTAYLSLVRDISDTVAKCEKSKQQLLKSLEELEALKLDMLKGATMHLRTTLATNRLVSAESMSKSKDLKNIQEDHRIYLAAQKKSEDAKSESSGGLSDSDDEKKAPVRPARLTVSVSRRESLMVTDFPRRESQMRRVSNQRLDLNFALSAAPSRRASASAGSPKAIDQASRRGSFLLHTESRATSRRNSTQVPQPPRSLRPSASGINVKNIEFGFGVDASRPGSPEREGRSVSPRPPDPERDEKAKKIAEKLRGVRQALKSFQKEEANLKNILATAKSRAPSPEEHVNEKRASQMGLSKFRLKAGIVGKLAKWNPTAAFKSRVTDAVSTLPVEIKQAVEDQEPDGHELLRAQSPRAASPRAHSPRTNSPRANSPRNSRPCSADIYHGRPPLPSRVVSHRNSVAESIPEFGLDLKGTGFMSGGSSSSGPAPSFFMDGVPRISVEGMEQDVELENIAEGTLQAEDPEPNIDTALQSLLRRSISEDEPGVETISSSLVSRSDAPRRSANMPKWLTQEAVDTLKGTREARDQAREVKEEQRKQPTGAFSRTKTKPVKAPPPKDEQGVVSFGNVAFPLDEVLPMAPTTSNSKLAVSKDLPAPAKKRLRPSTTGVVSSVGEANQKRRPSAHPLSVEASPQTRGSMWVPDLFIGTDATSSLELPTMAPTASLRSVGSSSDFEDSRRSSTEGSPQGSPRRRYSKQVSEGQLLKKRVSFPFQTLRSSPDENEDWKLVPRRTSTEARAIPKVIEEESHMKIAVIASQDVPPSAADEASEPKSPPHSGGVEKISSESPTNSIVTNVDDQQGMLVGEPPQLVLVTDTSQEDAAVGCTEKEVIAKEEEPAGEKTFKEEEGEKSKEREIASASLSPSPTSSPPRSPRIRHSMASPFSSRRRSNRRAGLALAKRQPPKPTARTGFAGQPDDFFSQVSRSDSKEASDKEERPATAPQVESLKPIEVPTLPPTPPTRSMMPRLNTPMRSGRKDTDIDRPPLSKLLSRVAKPMRMDVIADDFNPLAKLCRDLGSSSLGTTGGVHRTHLTLAARTGHAKSGPERIGTYVGAKALAHRGQMQLHMWGWELSDLCDGDSACLAPSIPAVPDLPDFDDPRLAPFFY